ncbi:hypothetical protein A1Q1_08115 [Trichosporon asahii var. asahii CBS 2479]|uniref:Uncharacterized protein n=1 Tax=Trichosporon asahii var. asahii (strain ATCC 90039 / CBS 2479 / JCM 2466 / KCTC 7840 / NBRC 103889/ NCYC 2677 / UAMH 7654) TaxID=1186058 RepID=J4UGV6_TRIAS|nr:hypothetical protein A1Q1_08115 [Trichosporon asahii var. asahii CBS 2479]EJT50740.1 hypothetical protein A1Q1_08115 [Trichosporon asahii var. asahii CBS 2479]
MGLFGKKKEEEPEPIPLLDPVEPPISVFPNMTRDRQVSLEYRQKLMTMKTEDFTVFDSDNDEPIVTVTGPAMYARKFKTVTLPNGEPLFKMRVKLAAVNLRIICEDAERGTEFFQINREWAFKLNLRQNLTVGDSPTLHLVGSAGGSQAKVTLKDSGQLVAVLDRVRWGKEGMQNKLTYRMAVAPGVDLALITALCLAWDKAKEDDRKRAAAASSGGGG